jgi:hypothetical protein
LYSSLNPTTPTSYVGSQLGASRAVSTAICSQIKSWSPNPSISTLSCTYNVAFLSYSASDQLNLWPNIYGFPTLTPVVGMGPSASPVVTTITPMWGELWVPTSTPYETTILTNSISSAADTGGNYLTGTFKDGSFAGLGLSANAWTSASPNVGMETGVSTLSDTRWIENFGTNTGAGTGQAILCACIQGTLSPTTKSPTTPTGGPTASPTSTFSPTSATNQIIAYMTYRLYVAANVANRANADSLCLLEKNNLLSCRATAAVMSFSPTDTVALMPQTYLFPSTTPVVGPTLITISPASGFTSMFAPASPTTTLQHTIQFATGYPTVQANFMTGASLAGGLNPSTSTCTVYTDAVGSDSITLRIGSASTLTASWVSSSSNQCGQEWPILCFCIQGPAQTSSPTGPTDAPGPSTQSPTIPTSGPTRNPIIPTKSPTLPTLSPTGPTKAPTNPTSAPV